MKIGLQAWGSEGDIQPFTALAAGLVAAGHEVTLVVTDNIGRDYSELANRFGYRLIAVPNPLITSAEESEKIWRKLIKLSNPIQQSELVMRYGFDPVVTTMYAAARKLCAENDVVVGHFFVYPLRIAAEIAGIPIATINIVHNCIPSSQICPPGLPDLGRWSYRLGWRLVRFMVNRIFLPRVNFLRASEGLRPNTDVMSQTWVSDKLNLIAVSPQICQAPPDWDARNHVCGFLNPPANLMTNELPSGLDAFLLAGSSPVYLSFGSMMLDSREYIQETVAIWVEAIYKVGCRAIIQFPGDDLSLVDTDEKIFKVSRVPYNKIFPRCSIVIHHGGAGTTQSTLLAGRPSIIVAHMSDQFFWGSELERLGVAGRTLKRNGLNAKQLADCITSVLDSPKMVSRALAIRCRMSKENGVAEAVRLIENLGNESMVAVLSSLPQA